MENTKTKEFVNLVKENKPIEAKELFNKMIWERASLKINTLKSSIAKSLFNKPSE